jgi:serine phosphatase RsbU (regulator of sigma subunit)
MQQLSTPKLFKTLRIASNYGIYEREQPLTSARDRAETYPLNGSKHGPALGLFGDAVYPNSHCELSPHDRLLLFTDGLFEVEEPGGDIYDYRRLLEAVNRRRELPAFQLCQEVIEEVERFSEGRHFSDDVCLVAMEVN